MKRSNFILLTIIFNLLFCSFISYLAFFRDNSFIFWSILICSAIIILIQINYASSNKQFNIIYLEIFVLYIGLKLISIVNVGVTGIFGLDNYYEIYSIQSMLDSGQWLPYTRTADTVTGYPAAHFLGSFTSLITNIKIDYLTIFLSSLIEIGTLLIIMLIGKKTFKDEKITLLTSLSFVFIFLFVYMNFGRMILSIILFFLIIFLFMRNYQKKITFTLLIILSMITLMYSHPMAPVILFVFIGLFLVIKTIYSKKIPIIKLFKNIKPTKINIDYNLFIILFVLILSYFTYISLWQQQQFLDTINILRGIESTQSIGTGVGSTLNWRIFILGQMAMAMIFGLLFLRYRKIIKNFNILIFITFGVLLGVISLLGYVINLDIVRFTIFLWPFLLFAFSYVVTQSKNKKALSVLVILFIAVNISGYYIDSYDTTYDIPPGTWRMHITDQEKAAVSSLNPEGYIVSNHYIKMVVLTNSSAVNLPGVSNFYVEGYKNSTRYKKLNFFFFEKDDMTALFLRQGGKLNISNETYSDYQKTTHLQRIYDNGDVDVYKIIKT